MRLLVDGGLPLGEWDSDTELVLDSLTFVWLVHLLEERHGIVVHPEAEEEIAASDSVGSLHRNLVRLLPGGPDREECRHAS
ncbi:hypothetical protein [Kitasatospora mediocidica]|uniref:hypothetical protein n=1 Tax=Kitasatospora mediocidica TaxID=58352 RepID=UPI000AD5992C|nr:hypothetical protein [Kitasatospora mediocidica]